MSRSVSTSRVYPRAGGGTERAIFDMPIGSGLSPRRRGNLASQVPIPLGFGSIPAQAGEPRARANGSRSTWVYPRAGGGTVGNYLKRGHDTGLSPRRRGNPGHVRTPRIGLGSIPAQAGEPPAVCHAQGETGGLSPRRRGNPDPVLAVRHGAGSIPAQAGEPATARPTRASGRVLSPRRRGNRLDYRRDRLVEGSIPAQAGEPKA